MCLRDSVQGARSVAGGLHFSGVTSLSETKVWAREWRGKGVDRVDPEIGHMAEVCFDLGVGFGFLHVVSDDLSKEG